MGFGERGKDYYEEKERPSTMQQKTFHLGVGASAMERERLGRSQNEVH